MINEPLPGNDWPGAYTVDGYRAMLFMRLKYPPPPQSQPAAVRKDYADQRPHNRRRGLAVVLRKMFRGR